MRAVILPANRAAWPALYREKWEERAAIIEFCGNLSRFTAEVRAEQRYSQNCERGVLPP